MLTPLINQGSTPNLEAQKDVQNDDYLKVQEESLAGDVQHDYNEQTQNQINKGCCSSITNMFQKYDNSVLMLLATVYFNQGFKVLLIMASLDYFKQYLFLQPDYTQFLISIMNLPWSFKILYGIIADNITIMGSRRKSYVIINGLLQYFSLTFIVCGFFEDEITITISLFICSLNGAFIDVVVDALMVVQSRRDPEKGSEELQSLCWVMVAVGGILGSISAAFFTQYLHPRYTFLFCSTPGLLISFFGWKLNCQIEEEGSNDRKVLGFKDEVKRNFREIKEALFIPTIYKPVLYMLLCGVLVPSFSSIGYYFNLNVVKFDKFTISMLTVIGFFTLLIGTLVYNSKFKKSEFRTLFMWSQIVGFIGGLFTLAFVLRWNLYMGFGDIAFIVFTGVVTDTLGYALTIMPGMVMYAKITPKHIEATIFAFLTGVSNFCNFVLSPMIGAFINRMFVNVTAENLSNFYILVILQCIMILAPLLFIRLIPLRKEIKEQQLKQIEDDKQKKDLEMKEMSIQ